MDKKKRPPIVTILGHVDHGKTTLLEYLLAHYTDQFKGTITGKEAGGITQKVRSFEITYKNQCMTFIDTPGHEAFAQLRQRGAQIADIGILIIAAEEGMRPQTKESLEFLQAQNMPFIIALNKVDKATAQPDKVRQELMEKGIMIEGLGGDIPVIEISAKTGQGVENLLEMIVLLSDLHAFADTVEHGSEGYILESIKDPKKGVVAYAVIQGGCLKTGDYIITATSCGKIKHLEDSFFNNLTSVCASKPISLSGFESLPASGEIFKTSSLDITKKIQQELGQRQHAFQNRYIIPEGNPEEGINVIIKADHIGSLEALEHIFQRIANECNVHIKILKADLGAITFEDTKFVKNTDSIIIAFNVKNDKSVVDEMRNSDITLLEGNIIYEIEDRLREIATKKVQKSQVAQLQVLGVFSSSASKKTIGGRVTKGVLSKNNRIRIVRADQEIGKGKIIELQKDKVAVSEVSEGSLCGLVIETHATIEKEDIIEALS